MLGWRLIGSAVLIPLLGFIFYLDQQQGPNAPILLAVVVLMAIRGCWELTTMLKTRSFQPSFLATSVCSCLILLAAWGTHWQTAGGAALNFSQLGLPMLVFSVSILALFLKGALKYREPGTSMETLGAELLTVSYIGVLLTLTAQLRWTAGGSAGYLALGSVIIAAKSGDIGAYTLGRLFGKKKMIPRLSPGKTWMGAWGAVLGSGLGSILWFQLATPMFNENWMPCEWYWAVLFGVIIGIVGLVGDLCESLIKRDLGQKDSAVLLPGFGGLLDLLDSVLYAGPVAYLLWSVLPLLPSV